MGAKKLAGIPALNLPVADADRPLRHEPLPLARQPEWRQSRTVCGVSSVDCHGRVSDLLVMRALGWTPYTRLGMGERSGVIIVRPDDKGMFTVSADGNLRLVAMVRRWCLLRPGDRVLLAADVEASVLSVYSPAAVDDLILGSRVPAEGGDAA